MKETQLAIQKTSKCVDSGRVKASPAAGELMGSFIVEDMTTDNDRKITIPSLGFVFGADDLKPEILEEKSLQE